jgi:hypothetical protein
MYANLSNADLTGADVVQNGHMVGVTWNNTTCPDGTNSDDNSNTCGNNLQ